MRKMGNFKGLPVFMVTDPFEWQNIKDNHSHEEKVYVYQTNVYYKNNLIAAISGDVLLDFNEGLFNELRRKSWDSNRAQVLAHVTNSAETRPQEEKKPVNECSDLAAADEFMLHWSDYIDNEIANLKKAVSKICLY